MSQPLGQRARRAVLTPSSVVIVVGAVFLAFLARDAFEAAHTTIGWVVACSVVAMLIGPLVGYVDRFLPRWLSVIVVLLAMISFVAGVVIGLAKDLGDSVEELQRVAPEAAAGLEERFAWAADIGVEDRVRAFVADLNDEVRSDVLSIATESVPTYLVTGILMIFILGYGRRYIASLVDQFDKRRRGRMREVISGAARRSQRYLLATLAHCTVNGVIVGLVCWMLDLPAASSLGVAVGAFTLLPLVGVLIGGVPALLLAFGLHGWGYGLVVLGVLLALQTIEVALVRPNVDPRSVRAGPTVPIIAGLLGFELYGIGGAVYSIALAVTGLAALDELGTASEPEQQALPLGAP